MSVHILNDKKIELVISGDNIDLNCLEMISDQIEINLELSWVDCGHQVCFDLSTSISGANSNLKKLSTALDLRQDSCDEYICSSELLPSWQISTRKVIENRTVMTDDQYEFWLTEMIAENIVETYDISASLDYVDGQILLSILFGKDEEVVFDWYYVVTDWDSRTDLLLRPNMKAA